MSCPLEDSINAEYKDVVRKEFTVYYKVEDQLYRKTTVRDFYTYDFIDSTHTIAIGKSHA